MPNVWSWLRAKTGTARGAARLREELAHHRAMLEAEAGERGLDPAEARRRAAIRLGGEDQIAERCRDQRGTRTSRWLDDLIRDLRFGLRSLNRSRGFAAAAIVTLALGIGANTAIFSVVNAALIQPLPFPHPNQLVCVYATEAAPCHCSISGANYLDWQAQNRTLASSSLFSYPQNVNASGSGTPESVSVISTQANFFSTLGASPLLGRAFAQREDRRGRDRVAVLSYAFWQSHFGGRKDVIGKTLDLNLVPYTLIGVMPDWLDTSGVATADLWTPLAMSPNAFGSRGNHRYQAIARLKSGIGPAAAKADLDAIAKRLAAEYPGSGSTAGFVLVPLREQLLGPLPLELMVLMGVTGLVLLIACINISNLLLVRAVGRRAEIAVRRSLGAARVRIIRQLMTESVLLWLLGGALGVAFGYAGLQLLIDIEPNLAGAPNPVAINGTVLWFTLAVSLFCGLLFGLAPAWRSSRMGLNEALRADAQGVASPGSRRHRLDGGLVVCEIAVALALAVGAGLLLRSLSRLEAAPLGFQPRSVISARIALTPKAYASGEAQSAFLHRLHNRLLAEPGVESVAFTRQLPLRNGIETVVSLPHAPAAAAMDVNRNYISPGYFQTLGVQRLAGRGFTVEDPQHVATLMRYYQAHPLAKLRPEDTIAGIVNEAAARRLWPHEDAVGKTLIDHGTPVRMVGVVANVAQQGLQGSGAPAIYLPLRLSLRGRATGSIAVLLRTTDTESAAAAILRRDVQALDPTLPVSNLQTMDGVVRSAASGTRQDARLLVLFAALALALTLVGIYSVMSYAMKQRTHEVAVRMALGARPADIVRLAGAHGLKLTLAGIAAGLALALGLTRFLAGLLFDTAPSDPATLAAAAVLVAAVAVAASLLPAWRAVHTNPARALRCE